MVTGVPGNVGCEGSGVGLGLDEPEQATRRFDRKHNTVATFSLPGVRQNRRRSLWSSPLLPLRPSNYAATPEVVEYSAEPTLTDLSRQLGTEPAGCHTSFAAKDGGQMALVGKTCLQRNQGKRLIGPAHQRLGPR